MRDLPRALSRHMLAPSAERLLPATLMGLLIGLLIVGATGCYSRVVKESGIGRGASKVYEPNLELPEDSDPWNLSAAGSSPGVKNWKAAGQKSQSSGTSSGKSSAD